MKLPQNGIVSFSIRLDAGGQKRRSYETPPGLDSEQIKRRTSNAQHRTSNIDIAAKRRKKHKNKISGLVISMGYETEIREF